MAEQATRHELAPVATRNLTRRQVVKAGAWAAPVIAIAVATPAATASLTGITFSSSVTHDPAPNKKNGHIAISINSIPANTTLSVSLTFNGNTQTKAVAISGTSGSVNFDVTAPDASGNTSWTSTITDGTNTMTGPSGTA